jgi:hypothetical protein
MNRYLIMVIVPLLLHLSAPWCWAGFQEATDAYSRGDYATAGREWLPLAQQGDAYAQYNLGLMYFNGQGVPQDYGQAMQWYRQAAEQGFAQAQHNLGFMYANGQGVPQDYGQAVQWYRRAAEQGHAGAQVNLGTMFLLGQGVPQDYGQAMQWYRQAAEQGVAPAQYNLGFMYEQGYGIPQDYAEALRWYRRAADQGDAYAQHGLGAMYGNGQGVPQDFVQAYFWLNLAAARLPPGIDYDNAVRGRDSVANRMTPAQLAQAQALARTWQPQPATPGALLSPRTPPSQPQELPLVWRVQERLKAVGFDPGPVDGAFGPQTRDALRGFQNSEGLPPTGELDEQTLNALGVR